MQKQYQVKHLDNSGSLVCLLTVLELSDFVQG